MAGVTRSQAIKAFLEQNTLPELASLYKPEMEVQVNMAQDGGERVDGHYRGKDWHGWTDGISVWKTFRMPRSAWTSPEENDYEIKFDMSEHVEAIGLTGWNWKEKKSCWVAFDFDAMVGHSNKHAKRLSESELDAIKEAVSKIDYVTLRYSTGGAGLHVYVFLEPVDTQNHNEHMALARAILSQLSAQANFDFKSKVDVHGAVMWIWHRKMNGTRGLSLIKQGTTLATVPKNWKDHVDVIKGNRKRIIPFWIQESTNPQEAQDQFEELSGQRPKTPLDKEHEKLLGWIRDNIPGGSWWDVDHWMLVTHTAYLKLAHEALNIRGVFDTLSKGTEFGADQNCFSGNTEVLTQDGVKTFKELVGKGAIKLFVKTPQGMKWIDSEIKCFGVQKTYPLYFGDGTSVRTTANHLWIDRKTNQRIPTYLLKEGKTELPIAELETPSIDWEGYAHGFVFGDGWDKNTRGKTTTEVSLFGQKKSLTRLLSRYGTIGITNFKNHGDVTTARQLPNTWKSLPKNPTKEYAFGFILGLISADGFVNSRVQISQSDEFVIESIRKLAMFCGLRPYKIRLATANGYDNAKQNYLLTISTYNLKKEMFLRKDQQNLFQKRVKKTCTTVSKIDWQSPKEEEVYCAVVPHYHNFTLGNLIITGNCFAFPLRAGGWKVVRYSPGVAEHPSWMQDGNSWTYCYYNRLPDFNTACRIGSGIERPAGGFVFKDGKAAIEVSKMLGLDLQLPERMLSRKTILKKHKDGRLIVELEKTADDRADDLADWIGEGKLWKRIYNVRVTNNDTNETPTLDTIVRHIITESRENYGWVLRSDGHWTKEPLEHLKIVLRGSLGYNQPEVDSIIGAGVSQPWTLVNRPFDQEFLPDRKWNRNAVQFRYERSQNVENLDCPTWLAIFNHLGKGLDTAVESNGWCKSNNIKSGADYLLVWVASLFQKPMEQLPYLFFWSEEQNKGGKSSFHEALQLLMTDSGYQIANTALDPRTNFNAELQTAILCVIEEKELNIGRTGSSTSYERIKHWVTGKTIQIHEKNKTPFLIPNTSHWVHCSNSRTACPVFPGDSRIVVIKTEPLDPIDIIPKTQLLEQLKKQAPDFLAYIMSVQIPESNDRLNLPVITTEEKLIAQEANMTAIELYIKEYCYVVDGEMIKWSEFYEDFVQKTDTANIEKWTKIFTSRHMPAYHPVGRYTQDAQFYVANLSTKPFEPGQVKKPRLISVDKVLRSVIHGETNGKHQEGISQSIQVTTRTTEVRP